MDTKTQTWHFGSGSIDCNSPVIMGVINVTPDSFSDGGEFIDFRKAIEHAKFLSEQGADILDIGGESTRPGSDFVSVDEELKRVIPVIAGIRDAGIDIPISVDTRKLSVAEKAYVEGAQIINDISALRDEPEMADFIAEKNLGVVLMHMLGSPKNMQVDPHYNDVISEIGEFFTERMAYAKSHRIPDKNIVIDPGIGFGKRLEDNLRILRECGTWLKFKHLIMIGASRKRFIGSILDADVKDRLHGTIGACVCGYNSGARIFRVHDVRPVREALMVAHAINRGIKA